MRCKQMIYIQSIYTQTVPNITTLLQEIYKQVLFLIERECRRRSSFFDLFVDDAVALRKRNGRRGVQNLVIGIYSKD